MRIIIDSIGNPMLLCYFYDIYVLKNTPVAFSIVGQYSFLNYRYLRCHPQFGIMVVSHRLLFFVSLVFVLTPLLLPKIIWINNSKTTTGTMRFVGKEYTGQLVHFYSVISFPVLNDTIWFNSSDNTIFEVGEKVPVIYRENDPKDAKVYIFSNLWADTVVYGTPLLIILLMIFLHPKGMSRKSKLYLSRSKPYARIG